ncbi:unnamed protein product [Notodromas monacha]|uniref:HTH La-type RNA-binding domain-containing protein n=1 Tax=Notodromas monacha TaxID=399045 RepID=A0A7R9GDD4_9CRUS|nr:unnamed protein product [Notodromas monacha]CAG0916846.1 unnamed protein product [Notodromas monacha]
MSTATAETMDTLSPALAKLDIDSEEDNVEIIITPKAKSGTSSSSSSAPIMTTTTSVSMSSPNSPDTDSSSDGSAFFDAASDKASLIYDSSQRRDSGFEEKKSSSKSKDNKENDGARNNSVMTEEEEDDEFVVPDKELVEKIVAQVEFYFSDASITKDAFLLKHVRRNKEGFVSLKLISCFKRVKHLTKDWRQVAYAIKSSSTDLEVNDVETKVRRKAALPETDETTPSRTVVAYNLPGATPSVESVAERPVSYKRLVTKGIQKNSSWLPIVAGSKKRPGYYLGRIHRNTMGMRRYSYVSSSSSPSSAGSMSPGSPCCSPQHHRGAPCFCFAQRRSATPFDFAPNAGVGQMLSPGLQMSPQALAPAYAYHQHQQRGSFDDGMIPRTNQSWRSGGNKAAHPTVYLAPAMVPGHHAPLSRRHSDAATVLYTVCEKCWSLFIGESRLSPGLQMSPQALAPAYAYHQHQPRGSFDDGMIPRTNQSWRSGGNKAAHPTVYLAPAMVPGHHAPLSRRHSDAATGLSVPDNVLRLPRGPDPTAGRGFRTSHFAQWTQPSGCNRFQQKGRSGSVPTVVFTRYAPQEMQVQQDEPQYVYQPVVMQEMQPQYDESVLHQQQQMMPEQMQPVEVMQQPVEEQQQQQQPSPQQVCVAETIPEAPAAEAAATEAETNQA